MACLDFIKQYVSPSMPLVTSEPAGAVRGIYLYLRNVFNDNASETLNELVAEFKDKNKNASDDDILKTIAHYYSRATSTRFLVSNMRNDEAMLMQNVFRIASHENDLSLPKNTYIVIKDSYLYDIYKETYDNVLLYKDGKLYDMQTNEELTDFTGKTFYLTDDLTSEDIKNITGIRINEKIESFIRNRLENINDALDMLSEMFTTPNAEQDFLLAMRRQYHLLKAIVLAEDVYTDEDEMLFTGITAKRKFINYVRGTIIKRSKTGKVVFGVPVLNDDGVVVDVVDAVELNSDSTYTFHLFNITDGDVQQSTIEERLNNIKAGFAGLDVKIVVDNISVKGILTNQAARINTKTQVKISQTEEINKFSIDEDKLNASDKIADILYDKIGTLEPDYVPSDLYTVVYSLGAVSLWTGIDDKPVKVAEIYYSKNGSKVIKHIETEDLDEVLSLFEPVKQESMLNEKESIEDELDIGLPYVNNPLSDIADEQVIYEYQVKIDGSRVTVRYIKINGNIIGVSAYDDATLRLLDDEEEIPKLIDGGKRTSDRVFYKEINGKRYFYLGDVMIVLSEYGDYVYTYKGQVNEQLKLGEKPLYDVRYINSDMPISSSINFEFLSGFSEFKDIYDNMIHEIAKEVNLPVAKVYLAVELYNYDYELGENPSFIDKIYEADHNSKKISKGDYAVIIDKKTNKHTIVKVLDFKNNKEAEVLMPDSTKAIIKRSRLSYRYTGNVSGKFAKLIMNKEENINVEDIKPGMILNGDFVTYFVYKVTGDKLYVINVNNNQKDTIDISKSVPNLKIGYPATYIGVKGNSYKIIYEGVDAYYVLKYNNKKLSIEEADETFDDVLNIFKDTERVADYTLRMMFFNIDTIYGNYLNESNKAFAAIVDGRLSVVLDYGGKTYVISMEKQEITKIDNLNKHAIVYLKNRYYKIKSLNMETGEIVLEDNSGVEHTIDMNSEEVTSSEYVMNDMYRSHIKINAKEKLFMSNGNIHDGASVYEYMINKDKIDNYETELDNITIDTNGGGSFKGNNIYMKLLAYPDPVVALNSLGYRNVESMPTIRSIDDAKEYFKRTIRNAEDRLGHKFSKMDKVTLNDMEAVILDADMNIDELKKVLSYITFKVGKKFIHNIVAYHTSNPDANIRTLAANTFNVEISIKDDNHC